MCSPQTCSRAQREGVRSSLLLDEDWEGKIPNIIKALRPERKLYGEALFYFTKRQTFRVHKGNLWSFLDMEKSAITTIIKLKIDLSDPLRASKIFENSSTSYRSMLEKAVNAREIELDCREISSSYTGTGSGFLRNRLIDRSYHVARLLIGAKRLKKVTIALSADFASILWPTVITDGALPRSIEGMNNLLGETAKLTTVQEYALESMITPPVMQGLAGHPMLNPAAMAAQASLVGLGHTLQVAAVVSMSYFRSFHGEYVRTSASWDEAWMSQ